MVYPYSGISAIKRNELSSPIKACRNFKCKKSILKGYIFYDSNCLTFWKRQNDGDSEKKTVVPEVWKDRRISR